RPRSGRRRRGRRHRGRGAARRDRAHAGLVHRKVPRRAVAEEWTAQERRAEERQEVIFYGWRIVAAAFVVLFTAYGAQYCFSIFFAALLDEFGWSRAGLSGVFSLYAFGYCIVGFPAGRLTDRWGPRIVVTTGGLLLGRAL